MAKGIFIGVGANLPGPNGESPAENLQTALLDFPKVGIQILNISKIYETEPWPPSDQPWYLNAVLEVSTDQSPEELLQTLLDIEGGVGRTRDTKNAPRTLDLDILDYNGMIIPSKGVWKKALEGAGQGGFFLPHLRAHLRNFVLRPLLDICPEWDHPVFNQSGKNLLATLKTPGGIKAYKEAEKTP